MEEPCGRAVACPQGMYEAPVAVAITALCGGGPVAWPAGCPRCSGVRSVAVVLVPGKSRPWRLAPVPVCQCVHIAVTVSRAGRLLAKYGVGKLTALDSKPDSRWERVKNMAGTPVEQALLERLRQHRRLIYPGRICM